MEPTFCSTIRNDCTSSGRILQNQMIKNSDHRKSTWWKCYTAHRYSKCRRLSAGCGDLCSPPSDASALCHVITEFSVIDPSQLPVCMHAMSCRSVYATLGYRWLHSMRTWRCTYSPLRLRPQHICRDVVLGAAVSVWGHLEAVFQLVSPWLCLSDHLSWLGSASDFLPWPRLGLIIFGSARLGFASALALSWKSRLCVTVVWL